MKEQIAKALELLNIAENTRGEQLSVFKLAELSKELKKYEAN